MNAMNNQLDPISVNNNTKIKQVVVPKIILAGAILSLISTIVTNKYFFASFDIARIIGNIFGSILLLSVLSFLFGLIPYFVFRKKISNSKIIIFGTLFIIFGIAISFGAIASRSDVDVNKALINSIEDLDIAEIKKIRTDKNPDYSEITGNLYRNTKYQFRIKFPEGWKIEVGDGIHIVQKASSENSTISVIVQQFDLGGSEGFSSIKDTGTSKEFIDVVIEGAKEKFSDVQIIDYGETKIDNEPAYWAEYSMSSQILDHKLKLTSLTYYLAKGDTLYSINAGTISDEYLEIKPLFVQTTSTFVLEN